MGEQVTDQHVETALTAAPPPEIAAIALRASIPPKHLVGPGPKPDEIAALMQAAASAPDHGALKPFRFILIAEDARPDLAKVFADAKRARDPKASNADAEAEAAKALTPPLTLCVVARIQHQHPKIPVPEQYASVGAAMAHVMLAAEAMGYRGMIVSGDRAADRRVCDALGLEPTEALMGFICLGSYPGSLPRKARATATQLLTVWTGQAKD